MIISVFHRVENNVEKGENAGYQHFLLFPQCLQKVSFPEASKGVIVWLWIKITDCIENIVEKGEIAHFEKFHLFPQCFPKVFFFNALK